MPVGEKWRRGVNNLVSLNAGGRRRQPSFTPVREEGERKGKFIRYLF